MAIRNSAATVCELLGIDSDINLYPQLRAASRLVDTHLADQGLADGVLQDIEAYLAAHMYRLANPSVAQESYEDGTFRYSVGRKESGFMATEWGQIAIQMDTSGTLKNLGKTRARILTL